MACDQIVSLIQPLSDATNVTLPAETESGHLVILLSHLQPFLSGHRNTIAYLSRALLVEVQQIQIIQTGCVLRLHEFQAAMRAIRHRSTYISLRDRMK